MSFCENEVPVTIGLITGFGGCTYKDNFQYFEWLNGLSNTCLIPHGHTHDVWEQSNIDFEYECMDLEFREMGLSYGYVCSPKGKTTQFVMNVLENKRKVEIGRSFFERKGFLVIDTCKDWREPEFDKNVFEVLQKLSSDVCVIDHPWIHTNESVYLLRKFLSCYSQYFAYMPISMLGNV